MADAGVVVVGGNQAAFSVANGLRRHGYQGPVRLLTAEPWLPYQRPPLSKAFVLEQQDPEELYFAEAAHYTDHEIDVELDTRAKNIDIARRVVEVAGGRTIDFDQLVIATGARSRSFLDRVPDGVCEMRTLADALDLRTRLERARRVVVIGAGFIGLEVASVIAKLDRGIAVDIVEAAPRSMSRVLTPRTAVEMERRHIDAGACFHFGLAVTGFTEAGGRLESVLLSDGTSLPCDLALLSIGVIPNVDLAENAGLPVENGVCVDATLRTEADGIWAIGDCAAFPADYSGGERIRLESVQNAIDQGDHVAAQIAGGMTKVYDRVPWFWSDQCGSKLQIAGVALGPLDVIERSDGEGRYTAYGFDGDRLAVVETIGRPGDHMSARKALERHVSPAREDVAAADFSFSGWLKQLA
jgi:3-phenylpropionate/trans-cinnamate dioxygenase ferredoxin reductase subunit